MATMTTKVKMPSVQIPTLNSVQGVVGTGFVSKGENGSQHTTEGSGTWADNHAVFIEELVQGVRHCQVTAKKAGEVLRRQRAEDVSRRPKSPLPINERKPWGFHQPAPSVSPRQRSSTPPSVSSQNPVTVAKPTLRPASARAPSTDPPPHAPTQVPPATANAKRPTTATTVSASSGSKLSPASVTKHTKGVDHISPTNRRVRSSSSQPLSYNSPGSGSVSSNTAAVDEQRMNALATQVKALEEQVMLANERAAAAERHASDLHSKVDLLSKDMEAQQLAFRNQVLHASAQQQHLWEVVRRLESLLSWEVAEEQHQTSSVSVNRGVSGGMMMDVDSSHVLSSATAAAAGGKLVGEDWSSGNVARRLDMSSDSSKSGHSRVPPNPPMDLRPGK